jgi:CRISPR-associated protein Csx10
MPFTLTVTMTSDWHVGTGAGRGDIDSVVQRDRDGLPYIPAKTLTGILRDACELVAHGLDEGSADGPWQQWVAVLFGDSPALAQQAVETPPRPAALSIRSAHFPPRLQAALAGKPELQTAIPQIRPGIAIDPSTGCAQTDYLRFEEAIRKGTTLQAPNCELALPAGATPEQHNAAYALFIAAVRWVERLGGKRRRGLGRCKMAVEANPHPWWDWLVQNPSPPPVPPQAETEPGTTTAYPTSSDASWYELPLRIETQAPLIVAARTVGNVVETLDYIPGRQLLRILHQTLGNWIDMGRAISRADAIATNATIQIGNAPGRPTPLALFAEKVTGGLDRGSVYNRLVEAEPETVQLKGLRSGYVGILQHGCLPPYRQVEPIVQTHNTIQDEQQRPTEAVGGVFSYQAIPTGTVLEARLRLRAPLVEQLKQQQASWWQTLQGTYRMGQSKKDDYGLVTIAPLTEPQPLSPGDTPARSQLTVWLLSDALLRDRRLRPCADLAVLRERLQTALGVTLCERQDPAHLNQIVRQRRTDAWQARWGLANQSMAGLQAGSCLVYELEGTLPDPKRLLQLEAAGIGERRAEGYGQIACNDPLLTHSLSQHSPASSPASPAAPSPAPVLAADEAGYDYACIIEEQAWRRWLQERAVAVAADSRQRWACLGIRIQWDQSEPPMSQLGALKSVVRGLRGQAHRPQVKSWLDGIRARDNRKDKWPEGSLDAIQALVADDYPVWTQLKGPDTGTEPPSVLTEGARSRLRRDLWAEAVRTLIDACIRAHKRELEKTTSNYQETIASHGTPN